MPKIPKLIRVLFPGLVLLTCLGLTCGILFFHFENYTLQESIYMAVITMTTVGYGDYTPHSLEGQMVSIFLAVLGIMLYGYLAAMIMSVVMESSLKGVFGMSKCKFKDHFVICGWNNLSEVVIMELIANNREAAVITTDQDNVPIINRIEDKGQVFAIFGDPSHNEVLEQAQVREASVVILTMQDDSKNLITALHIKEMNPKARVIVRTTRAELKKTMKIAGVTYVVTPDVMAGRLIASAAFEPEVADFIEDVTSATDYGGYDLREYRVYEGRTGTVSEVSKALREKTKTTLVGVARPIKKKGKKKPVWELLPNPDDKLEINKGDMVLLLGNEEQFKRAEGFMGTKQGR